MDSAEVYLYDFKNPMHKHSGMTTTFLTTLHYGICKITPESITKLPSDMKALDREYFFERYKDSAIVHPSGYSMGIDLEKAIIIQEDENISNTPELAIEKLSKDYGFSFSDKTFFDDIIELLFSKLKVEYSFTFGNDSKYKKRTEIHVYHAILSPTGWHCSFRAKDDIDFNALAAYALRCLSFLENENIPIWKASGLIF